jgi:hypothetical protein
MQHVDHWFSRTRPSDVEDALATATALVADLNVGDTPGLAAALAAAERGEPVVVTLDSDLGRHVREWSTLARRASWSINLDRGRMTDEGRQARRSFRPPDPRPGRHVPRKAGDAHSALTAGQILLASRKACASTPSPDSTDAPYLSPIVGAL